MAKGIKTGGRKKGTPNRATAAKAAEIAATGELPLDFMLRVMRDPKRDFEMRLDAAKAAAQYVHPKLTAIEHTGKDGEPIFKDLTESDLAREVAFLLTSAVKQDTVQ